MHVVTERFGFRTFEVRPRDGVYLNGRKIVLKGINRHSFNAKTGRTLTRAQNYADVRLIKGANMNAVRMSHYPPDPAFLEAADELGLYVLDELAGWQGFYDTPDRRAAHRPDRAPRRESSRAFSSGTTATKAAGIARTMASSIAGIRSGGRCCIPWAISQRHQHRPLRELRQHGASERRSRHLHADGIPAWALRRRHRRRIARLLGCHGPQPHRRGRILLGLRRRRHRTHRPQRAHRQHGQFGARRHRRRASREGRQLLRGEADLVAGRAARSAVRRRRAPHARREPLRLHQSRTLLAALARVAPARAARSRAAPVVLGEGRAQMPAIAAREDKPWELRIGVEDSGDRTRSSKSACAIRAGPGIVDLGGAWRAAHRCRPRQSPRIEKRGQSVTAGRYTLEFDAATGMLARLDYSRAHRPACAARASPPGSARPALRSFVDVAGKSDAAHARARAGGRSRHAGARGIRRRFAQKSPGRSAATS